MQADTVLQFLRPDIHPLIMGTDSTGDSFRIGIHDLKKGGQTAGKSLVRLIGVSGWIKSRRPYKIVVFIRICTATAAGSLQQLN